MKMVFRTFVYILLASAVAKGGRAQFASAHPGRGAMSAQDMAKMMTASSAESDSADQICPRFPAGSPVGAPAELRSKNGLLEVTLKFLSVTDSKGLVRYCYITSMGEQSPTLRLNPGDTLLIHLQNGLPTTGDGSDNMAGMNMTLSPQAGSQSTSCGGAAMSAGATNLHFHGTNVAPVCGQDEVVTTLVQPGTTFDYRIQIPQNEPPGLYWYHPHVHGFSEGQVQGGATGAIIVEGLENVDAALAGMPERTLIIRDSMLPASEADDPNIPAWDLSINYVPVAYPIYTPAVIEATPGEQELWRVANTAADTILNLQYRINGSAQTLKVVAIDGYPIKSGSSGQVSSDQTSILLGPGARAEFVVTTPSVGLQGQLVTGYWNTGPDGDFDPTRTLATVVNAASDPGTPEAHADGQTQLGTKTRPSKGIRFAALASAIPVAQRMLYFSEVLENPADPNSPTNFFITEQGQSPTVFSMGQPPNIVVHAGSVEDWIIENRAMEDHIFHIHQIHFQVLEVNGVAVSDPAVRDTVDLPYWSGTGAYPSVKVRMDFRDSNIIGTFVYHCHILQHEDAGMMGEIEVLPSGSTSAVSATASASSIEPNGVLTMTASVTDAATNLSLPDGVVQFQLNGSSIGNPVAVVNGTATLTTPVNGTAGINSLSAFYQGDSSYAESVSEAVPITVSDFALASKGAAAPVGSAVNVPLTVNVANGYTSLISFSCKMPASLTESACFIDPSAITGSGQIALTVNTTPAHPLSSKRSERFHWFAASGSASFSAILLLGFPRRAWRAWVLSILGCVAAVFTAAGCGAAVQVDPGTAKGSYSVLVTATADSGAQQYLTTIRVPITIQ